MVRQTLGAKIPVRRVRPPNRRRRYLDDRNARITANQALRFHRRDRINARTVFVFAVF